MPVAYKAAAAILIFVLGIARAELPNRNVQACDAGYSSCNESLLSEDQKRTAHGYALQRNVQACDAGYSSCDELLYAASTGKSIDKKSSPSDAPLYSPTCAENGSCYGDVSKITGRPKTTHINGYYRKDGTYVRGHYRSRK